MKPRYYFIALVVATVLSWSSWLLVVNNFSPFLTGYLALFFFYISFLVALVSGFSLFLFSVNYFFLSHIHPTVHLRTSIRRSFLISFIILFSLIFQRLRILNWWDLGLLFVIVLLVEYYFTRTYQDIAE